MKHNQPWDLRTREAPSELLLDAFVTGEATAEERAQVEAWAAGDPARQALLERRGAGFAALPMADPAALRAGIEARLAAISRAPAAPAVAEPVWRRWRLAWLIPLTAAAAAVTFLVLSRPPDAAVEPGGVQVKGAAPSLRVFRQHAGQTTELAGGAAVRMGDRLRFRPEGLPPGGHVLVVGREASGQLFAYAPADGRSLDRSALDPEGALPGSAELDASTGAEDSVLVWCPTAFELAALASAPAGVQAPSGCRTAVFPLVKQ